MHQRQKSASLNHRHLFMQFASFFKELETLMDHFPQIPEKSMRLRDSVLASPKENSSE